MFIPHIHWAPLIARFGYPLIFMVVGLESSGVPFPGEAMLITAAAYAGLTHHLDIGLIIFVAATAAICGSASGYWIGRSAGVVMLQRYGGIVGLNENRLRLGQYIFQEHGGAIVFVGRFVSVLRAFASLLAGASGLEWRRFLFFTVAGSIVWAIGFGVAAYLFGHVVHRIAGPIGLATLIGCCLVLGIGWRLLKRHEAHLQAKADAAMMDKGAGAARVHSG